MFSWQGPQATETHVSRKERDLLQDTRVWEEPKRSWTWGWSQEGSGTQKCCPWKVFLPLRPAQRAAQATEQGDVITPKVKFTSPPCKRPPGLNKNFSFPILLSRNCRLHLLSMKSSFSTVKNREIDSCKFYVSSLQSWNDYSFVPRP